MWEEKKKFLFDQYLQHQYLFLKFTFYCQQLWELGQFEVITVKMML